MRKTEKKKLVLAKETVRDLEVAKLSKAAGGSPTDEFWSCRVCHEADTAITNCY